MSGLKLYLLGGFEARRGDVPLMGFKTNKVRALLAYMSLEGRRPQRREKLVGLLWPGYPERSARASLRHALSNLRKVLGGSEADTPVLLVEGERIQLNPEADFWVDVGAFEAEMTERRLEEAVSFYRGSFLEGFALKDSPEFDNWVRVVRETLGGQMMAALAALAERYEEQGDYERSEEVLRRSLAIESWREESHRQLIRVLALSGARSAALAQFAACQRELQLALGVAPSEETVRLHERIRSGELAEEKAGDVKLARTETAAAKRQHNLPRQLTSFIGREREIETIVGMLAMNPLVTLAGPGGVGKTRAALQAAGAVIADYRDGVWLVDLASVTDPGHVVADTARVIGMQVDTGPDALDVLLAYCRERQMLLVLDNCEHLVEVSAEMAESVLVNCPQITILATSREILGVPGEAVFSLDPFLVPDEDSTFEDAAQNQAVRLFVERAQKLQPNFTLTTSNASSVVGICAQLDGIPLAIELAAALVRLLPIGDVNLHLKENLDYLRGSSRKALAHQQTMRGCLNWSYDLLAENEQHMLQSLSVFAGGWTLEAAETVCASDHTSKMEVFELMNQLVLKSLVQVEHEQDAEARYRLLEPVRQYAHEKLRDSGNEMTIHECHLKYYSGMVKQSMPYLDVRDIFWLRRLERELSNLRGALRWACHEERLIGDLETGMVLAADLMLFWQTSARYQEGAQYLERMLEFEAVRRENRPFLRAIPVVRAWALTVMIWLQRLYSSSIVDFYAHAKQCFDESRAIYQQSRVVHPRGQLLCRMMIVDYQSGLSYEKKVAVLEQIYTEADELNVIFIKTQSLYKLGLMSGLVGNFNAAEQYLQKCLTLSLDIHDNDLSSGLYSLLALITYMQGKSNQARKHADKARQILSVIEHDLPHAFGYGHYFLGILTWRFGDYNRAESDFIKAQRLGKEIQREILWVDFYLAGIASSGGDYDLARDRVTKLIDKNQNKYDDWAYVWGIYILGELDWIAGAYDRASESFAKLLYTFDDDPRYHQILGKWGLARVAISIRQWRLAVDLIGEALKLQLEQPPMFNIISSIENVIEDYYCAVTLTAFLSAAKTDFTAASQLFGAANRSFQYCKMTFSKFRRQLIDQTIADTRAALDEETFNTAWEEGKAMDLDQALAYALEVVEGIRDTK